MAIVPSARQIKDAAFKAIHLGLASLGFRRRAEGILTTELAPEVLGWIGLNRSLRGGELELTPVLGVRHQAVERVIADCCNAEFHAYVPATVSAHIGYLTPRRDYHSWRFTNLRVLPGSRQFVGEVEQFGLPYMRRLVDLAALLRELRASPYTIPEQAEYRRPVVLHLLGRNIEAAKLLQKSLANRSDRDDAAARYFVAFAKRLRERM